MFQGLRTVIYGVADIAKVKQWYTEALGFGPYFDEPFYRGGVQAPACPWRERRQGGSGSRWWHLPRADVSEALCSSWRAR